MRNNDELLSGFSQQLAESHALLKKLNDAQAQLEQQKQDLLIEIAKIECRRDLTMLSIAMEDKRLNIMLNTVH